MNIQSGNLFAGVPANLPNEHVLTLVTAPNVRIERIVSRGHTSPAGFWYDQPQAEWVMVLQGSAGVMFEGEASPRTLRAGDFLHFPARVRHRVEWTAENTPTIWLAVHYR
jgi:cupin 2 domain-containing protein